MKRDLEIIPLLIISAMLAYGTLVGVALCVKGCSSPEVFPAPIVRPDTRPEGDVAAQVLRALNATRARYGLAPVRLDARLSRAAQKLADGLASGRMAPHQGFPERLTAEGFPVWLDGRQNVSEGNAMGQTSARECIDSLNSEDDGHGNLGGHTRDIRSKEWRLIGVGYARGGTWGHNWVIEYARRHQ